MKAPTCNIFIFTALECEAKGLVNFFKLKKQLSHPFSIYREQNIVLTVTGVGKNAMAGGVTYTLALFSNGHFPVLVNIGIAGHKWQSLGSLFLANKINDVDSKKTFYPQLIGNGWPDTYQVNTFSSPNTLYSDDCLKDMEASAFYEMAVKFSCCELIHCIKIVSDNQNSAIDHIHAGKVSRWVEDQMNVIESLLIKLSSLHQIIAPTSLENYHKIVNSWHFTTTGKIKLKSLLIRWKALTSDEWFIANNDKFLTGKEIIKKIELDIAGKEFHL